MAERVYLYDSTLRDGAQTQGVDFGVADKIAIARALDRLGIDYVEGGWPGANPTDDSFFSQLPTLSSARISAFGMTRRSGRSAGNDPGLAAVLSSPAKVACLVGKTWDFHVDLALGVSKAENIDMIAESLAEAVARGKEAVFDAEHFFDGWKANPGFALDCLKAALGAGARWIVLCDTNGGTLPHEVERIVGEVVRAIPGEKVGIHCHNDTENAVANSLAAVRAGARQIQGTLNGLGERCGNANLISVIPNLVIKMGFETGVTSERLTHLTSVSRLLDERLNRTPMRNAAFVGESAFAHKGGLHVSAVEKDPRTYEHIPPEIVGNRRHVVVSDQSGRSNVLARFKDIGLEIDPKSPVIGRLLDEIKEREHEGYTYDGADGSFELLARRLMHGVPDYFRLNSFRVISERRFNARGELVTMSESTVKLDVGGERRLTVGEGKGPVEALDRALRAALLPFYPGLADLKLVDYKVRILAPERATAAVTRVMIESADGHAHGEIRAWGTVGVSENVIDASYMALNDSITWKLYRDGIAAPGG
ncbi:MAG: citramalate synthase [Alphaproteobacteria bacterium]|nr:citramalate synthase [Alphaproteobacteria bacterium]